MNHDDTTDTTCQLSVNACVVAVVSLWLESCLAGGEKSDFAVLLDD